MSRFIDRLNRLSRAEPQPIGFRAAQPTAPKLRIQLVASLLQESAESLVDQLAAADAGLLRISKSGSGARTLGKLSQAVPDIPWGAWLHDSSARGAKQIIKAGSDFVVFPASDTPLATIQNEGAGKILEVETSIGEGLLRAANELPVDAILVAHEQKEDYSLTWQHLMLLRRFASLLTKPLLVSVPLKVTADELQVVWQAGVAGVVAEMRTGQPPDRLAELRQAIDRLTFPSPRQREKAEPVLPGISRQLATASIEEEEEEGEEEG